MRGATRLARWFALVWALGAGAFLAFAPLYSRRTATLDGDIRAGSGSLLEVNGPAVLAILCVPALAAALAFLPLAHAHRRLMTLAATVIVLLVVVLGALTIGVVFAPTAIALAVASAGTGSARDPAA